MLKLHVYDLNCTPTIRQFSGPLITAPYQTVIHMQKKMVVMQSQDLCPQLTWSLKNSSEKWVVKQYLPILRWTSPRGKTKIKIRKLRSRNRRKISMLWWTSHLPWSRYVKEIEKGVLTTYCVSCYLFSYPGSLFVSVLFCYIRGGPILFPFSTDFSPSQVETTPVSSHRFFSFLWFYFISRY